MIDQQQENATAIDRLMSIKKRVEILNNNSIYLDTSHSDGAEHVWYQIILMGIGETQTLKPRNYIHTDFGETPQGWPTCKKLLHNENKITVRVHMPRRSRLILFIDDSIGKTISNVKGYIWGSCSQENPTKECDQFSLTDGESMKFTSVKHKHWWVKTGQTESTFTIDFFLIK